MSTYSNSTTRLKFGKWAGRYLSDPVIPNGYLAWLASEANIDYALLREVEAELDRRTQSESRYQAPPTSKARIPQGVRLEVALQLVEAGRRNMALKHHPDMGGDNQKMAELNASADWLSEHLAEVLK